MSYVFFELVCVVLCVWALKFSPLSLFFTGGKTNAGIQGSEGVFSGKFKKRLCWFILEPKHENSCAHISIVAEKLDIKVSGADMLDEGMQ